jgi:hypothetical protein
MLPSASTRRTCGIAIWALTRGPESRLGAFSLSGNLAMVFSCFRLANKKRRTRAP